MHGPAFFRPLGPSGTAGRFIPPSQAYGPRIADPPIPLLPSLSSRSVDRHRRSSAAIHGDGFLPVFPLHFFLSFRLTRGAFCGVPSHAPRQGRFSGIPHSSLDFFLLLSWRRCPSLRVFPPTRMIEEGVIFFLSGIFAVPPKYRGGIEAERDVTRSPRTFPSFFSPPEFLYSTADPPNSGFFLAAKFREVKRAFDKWP